MIVVVVNCRVCGRNRCRGMVVEFDPAFDGDEGFVEDGWIIEPPCSSDGESTWIGPSCVKSGDVFRVVDPGLESSQSQATTKKRERVK